MLTLCDKILCLYNLKAKTRSKNFVQKCQIIIDGKSAERIYSENGGKAYWVVIVSCDEEKYVKK